MEIQIVRENQLNPKAKPDHKKEAPGLALNRKAIKPTAIINIQ
ncbi:hypothetical protein A33Q_3050 [Indibacter alkaliphilus LW1]|uniref:Uncharacterized protein n=1 Tax=Indibacter alkaliphilus (strain CCUG 57479 / KCTC 22604 / LW1) TaxID=1189612 RepID=S2E0T4_INDAL|nr:hypothetical protein A33Q_3050 [Indibacter alkaliphilus LW1]